MPGTLLCVVSNMGPRERALEVAAEVCSRLGMRLVLVVVEGGSDPVAAAADERGARLRLVRRLVSEWGLTGEVEFRAAGGKSAARLGWIVAEESADLIVVGSTRRGWLRRGVMCELAERLACETKVPIVITLPHRQGSPRSDSLEVIGSR